MLTMSGGPKDQGSEESLRGPFDMQLLAWVTVPIGYCDTEGGSEKGAVRPGILFVQHAEAVSRGHSVSEASLDSVGGRGDDGR